MRPALPTLRQGSADTPHGAKFARDPPPEVNINTVRHVLWHSSEFLDITHSTNTPNDRMTGQRITDAKLFHLAPLVCLKFRGLDCRDEELRKKVTEGALANYVANSDPDGVDHELESRPLLAFAACYVTGTFAPSKNSVLVDSHGLTSFGGEQG